MFSVTFIANIVVLGIGGILLLVGILLLGFGIYSFIKSRRMPDPEMPSYSLAVDYPSEPGMDHDFEDEPRWANQLAADNEPGVGGGGAGAGAGAGGTDASGQGGRSGQAVGSGQPALSGGDAAAGWWSKERHGREKALIGVGSLLVLIGLYMLLSTIALIA